MQFKKGAKVPLHGTLWRVVSCGVFNGHVCYQLEDAAGSAMPIAHAQHTEIVATIAALAKYQVMDRLEPRTPPKGLVWVRERKWDSRAGAIMYRLNDYWDEGRWHTWVTQEVLDATYVHVGWGMTEPKKERVP